MEVTYTNHEGFTCQILPYREKKKRPSDAMAACGSSTSRNTGGSYTPTC